MYDDDAEQGLTRVRHGCSSVAPAEAADAGALSLKSEKRDTLKSHVLLEARRARLTSELQASGTRSLARSLTLLLHQHQHRHRSIAFFLTINFLRFPRFFSELPSFVFISIFFINPTAHG